MSRLIMKRDGKRANMTVAARGNRNNRNQSRGDAPMSRGTNNVTMSTTTMVQTGQDRLGQVNVGDSKDAATDGKIIFERVIDPSTFARLRNLAGSFQKIQYMNLEFVVTGKCPTVTSGGYIAGFVADADDNVTFNPKEPLELKNFLASQDSTVSAKWWETTSIIAPIDRSKKFYTDSGIDPREYSPGRFYIVVDGASDQGGLVTVDCRWTVKLMEASAPRLSKPEVDLNLQNMLYVRKDHEGFWYKDSTGTDQYDITRWKEDVKVGDRFRMTDPMDYTEAPAYGVTRYFDVIVMAESGSEHTALWLTVVEPVAGTPRSTAFTSNTVVGLKGDVWKAVDP